MTQPLPLDTIQSEFSEDSAAWVLQSKTNGLYLAVPDPRYPGRNPLRVFLSKLDAERFLTEVLKASPQLTLHQIAPASVKLLAALRSIATGGGEGGIDSYVVHSPNEVYEFMRDRLS